jgi:hypothetical protein
VRRPASQEQRPYRSDHKHVPEDGFKKRPPGLAGINKDIIPERPGPRSQSDTGQLPAQESIAQIPEKDAVGRLEFEQQFEARRGLEFGIHFQNTKAQALVDGRKLGSGGRKFAQL